MPEVSAPPSSSSRGSCTNGGWPVRGTWADGLAIQCSEFSTGQRRDRQHAAHVIGEPVPCLPHLMRRTTGPNRIRCMECPDGGDGFSHFRRSADPVCRMWGSSRLTKRAFRFRLLCSRPNCCRNFRQNGCRCCTHKFSPSLAHGHEEAWNPGLSSVSCACFDSNPPHVQLTMHLQCIHT